MLYDYTSLIHYIIEANNNINVKSKDNIYLSKGECLTFNHFDIFGGKMINNARRNTLQLN